MQTDDCNQPFLSEAFPVCVGEEDRCPYMEEHGEVALDLREEGCADWNIQWGLAIAATAAIIPTKKASVTPNQAPRREQSSGLSL
ncbi:hypothetical protein A7C91_05695 [Thermococcus piezophilus]|uniref:Uncharacterized protein n=1 Tax=Thermococcus piezophilus TaxID=1712654 RepID=A0A172WH72_9EURY|nr:hypothetical protein A7C91_05695 [Thermococcus piezophilus]